jgi:SPP1 Gp6-like portal protein
VLTEEEAIAAASSLRGNLETERNDFDVLRRYATGQQALPLVVPRDAPAEVRELARTARINLIAIVINSLVQSLYVDNIRVSDSGPARPPADPTAPPDPNLDDPDKAIEPIWQAWQRNRFDRVQGGLYRAVFQYGHGYTVITPGEPTPVMRAVSPRRMTALYDDDAPDFPVMAMEWRKGRGNFYRLYAEDDAGDVGVYTLGYDPEKKRFALLKIARLDLTYVPVIRHIPNEDLDTDDEPIAVRATGSAQNTTVSVLTAGEVAPLMTLQDQTDITSFALKSAEWYSAFRQRYIKGWTPEDRAAKMRSAASQLWTFEEHPDDIALGEFSQTDLTGFLASREAVLKYAATLSETPVHELIGELVNLSAEALAAAEAGRDRKIELAKTSLGESIEQQSQVVGDLMGVDVPDDIETVWRDTSARAFGAVVDGLGKIAQMLNVPAEMLWDRIPGTTRQDVERWKARAAQGDSLGQLTSLLNAQAGGAGGNPPPTTNPDGTTTRPGGLILPPGARA